MKIDNWKTVRLGDVCEAKQLETTVKADEKVWILNLDKIEPNTGKILGYDFMNYSELGQSVCHFNESNVLYSKLRPYLNKVVLPKQEGFATSELVPLFPCKELSRDFLAAFLRSDGFVSLISGKVAGAKMPRVVMKDFYDTKIPLPSLAEQKHIATVLDKCTAVIARHKLMLEKYDTLIKSQFVEMFEKSDFEKQIVEFLCTEIVDCPHTTPKYSGHLKNPAIRTSEIKKGYITWDSMKYVSDDEYKERTLRLTPNAGDIVYGREGSFGNAAILPKGYNFCLGQRVMLLRPDYKKCNSEYLLHALISDDVYNQALSKNNASTVAHVNVKDVKQFQIPLPPLSLQNNFAQFVQAVDAQKAKSQQSLEKAETLYKSLMQEYFG